MFQIFKSHIQTSPRYQYQPLNEEAREIRLLTLLPGKGSSSIKVAFHQEYLLDDGKTQEYEALSYAWGSKKGMRKIQVQHGAQSAGSIQVTRNLAIALSYLRYSEMPRLLWIDALCIDQENDKEKGPQFQMMGDIYRLAHRVVAWLGPEDKTSRQILQILGKLGSRINVNLMMHTMEPAPGQDLSWVDRHTQLPWNEHTWQALDDLLARPYFKRIWIQQEFNIANDRAVVMCGHDTITRKQFGNALFCIEKKPTGELPFALSMNHVDHINSAIETTNKQLGTFPWMLHKQRQCECFDPRDRIFALLSLRQRGDKEIDIKVDYTKTWSEVYVDFAIQYVLGTKRLRVLNSCQIRGNERTQTDLPSWVPDWSRDVSKTLNTFSASGNSLHNLSCNDRGLLPVVGVVSATMKDVKPELLYPGSMESVLNTISNWTLDENMSSSYVTTENLLDVYCRTLCAGDFSDLLHPPRTIYPDFQKSRQALETLLQ